MSACIDEDRCATIGCDQPAAVTYLGRLRCQQCYEAEVADDDEVNEEPTTNEEHDMSKKNAKKAGKAKITRLTRTQSAKKTAKRAAKQAAEPNKAARGAKAQANGTGPDKPTRPSALNAAAEVLRTSGSPMNCKALINAMAERGLWTSPAGKTPHATLYAAILREMNVKGKDARFRKTSRGLFEFAGNGK